MFIICPISKLGKLHKVARITSPIFFSNLLVLRKKPHWYCSKTVNGYGKLRNKMIVIEWNPNFSNHSITRTNFLNYPVLLFSFPISLSIHTFAKFSVKIKSYYFFTNLSFNVLRFSSSISSPSPSLYKRIQKQNKT